MEQRLEHAKFLMRSERPGLHVAGVAALARLAVLGEDQHVASGAAACLADAVVVESSPVLRYVAARTAAAAVKDAERRRRGNGSLAEVPMAIERAVSCDTSSAGIERGAAIISKLKIVLYSNDPCARAMAFSLLGTLAPVVAQGDDLEIWHAIWKALEDSDPTELGAACIAMCSLCGISESFAEATLPRAVSRLRSLRTDCETASRIVPVMRTMHHNATLAFASHRASEQLIDDGMLSARTLKLALNGLTELAMRAPGNVRAQQRLLHRLARFDERSAVRVTSLHCLRKLAMACAVASAHTVVLDAVWFVRRVVPLMGQGHEDDAVSMAERLATARMMERVIHHSRNALRTFSAEMSDNSDDPAPSTSGIRTGDVVMEEDEPEEKETEEEEDDIPGEESAENKKRDTAWNRRYFAQLQSNLREATLPCRGGEYELSLRFTCAIALLKVYAIDATDDMEIAPARDTCTTCFEILAECAALPVVRASMKRLATELVSTLIALVRRRQNLQDDLCQMIVCALQQVISWAPRPHVSPNGNTMGNRDTETFERYEPMIFVVRVLVRCYSSIFSSFNEGIRDGDARGHTTGTGGTAIATSSTMMMLEPIERCIDMLTRVGPDLHTTMVGDARVTAILELPGETEVKIMTPLARFCIEAYVRASKGFDGRHAIELIGTDIGSSGGGLPHAQRFSGQIKRRIINIAQRLMTVTNLDGTDRQCGSAVVSIYALSISCLCCSLYQAAYALLDIATQHVISEWNVAWLRGLQLIAEAGIAMEGRVVSRHVATDGDDEGDDTAMDDNDNDSDSRIQYAYFQNGTEGNGIALRLALSVDRLRNAEESISNAFRLCPREFKTERIRTLARLVRLRFEQQRLMQRLTADVFILLSSFERSGMDMNSTESNMGGLNCDRSREALVADFMGIVRASLELYETLDGMRTVCASPFPSSCDADGAIVSDKDEDSLVEYRVVSAMTGCIAHAVATCIENTYADERHGGDAGLCTDCVVEAIVQPLRNVLWEWGGGLKVQTLSEKSSKAVLVYNALIGRKGAASAADAGRSVTSAAITMEAMPEMSLCSLSELSQRVLEGTDIAAKATESASATTLTALHRLAAAAACIRCHLPKWLVSS